jgi:hypothetical protein
MLTSCWLELPEGRLRTAKDGSRLEPHLAADSLLAGYLISLATLRSLSALVQSRNKGSNRRIHYSLRTDGGATKIMKAFLLCDYESGCLTMIYTSPPRWWIIGDGWC